MPTKQSYYVSGNTSEGFVNYLPSNVESFHHVIILKHYSATLQTAVIQEVIKQYEKDFDLEIILSTRGREFLDGVIVREKSFAVIVEQIATADLSGAIEVDLNLFLARRFNPDQDMINQIEELMDKAYESFATGLKIHDELEEIYINEMDFEKANQIADDFIKEVLPDEPKGDKSEIAYHRLFGTNTKDGVVNIVPEIVQSVSKAYYVKGRAGTGKSTFMKKVLSACQALGYPVELYHCSFDPNSVDMVLVRELDFCLFDSTDPHEYFPERDSDEVIDLYEQTVTPGTDEKFATEIEAVHSNYKSYMKKGVEFIKQAGKLQDELEREIDFNREVDKITTFILGKIIQ